jgi:hypothetical protein
MREVSLRKWEKRSVRRERENENVETLEEDGSVERVERKRVVWLTVWVSHYFEAKEKRLTTQLLTIVGFGHQSVTKFKTNFSISFLFFSFSFLTIKTF